MSETPTGTRPDTALAPGATVSSPAAPDPTGARMHRVELLRLPLRLVVAGREHHDGLMREFRLLALSGQFGRSAAPARLVELVAILGQQYASAREGRDEEVDAALRRGEDWADLTMDVPETAAVAARSLRGLLDEADAYCEHATLMTLPRPPLIRQFSSWYFAQVIDQIAGEPARPWEGPLRP